MHKTLKIYWKHFWKRSQNEYLTELREIHKNINHSAKREVKVGELVSISDENSQRHGWRVAVVEELISSEDEYVRGCKLRITYIATSKAFTLESCGLSL